MKKFKMMYWILAMLLVVSLVMVGCAGNEAPEATTEVVMAATEAAPTEPVETKPAFVPERYEPTLPPEPTVPETVETEPTEAVEEEDDYYDDDYYYEEEDSSGTDYTPAPTEAPAPVETVPPETEAPVTVSYDYNAAANYGNSHAVSTYGWYVDSSVEGYYPASSISIEYAVANGGQSYINARMAEKVDSSAWNLGCESGYGVWCDCWESDGWIYFVVYYG